MSYGNLVFQSFFFQSAEPMKPDRLRPVRFTVLKHQVTACMFPIAVTAKEGGFSFFFLSGRIQDVSQDVTEAMGRWECKVTSIARREQ